MDVTEIIKKLGGAPRLASALGLPGEGVGALRVRAWGYRQSIPGEYWADIAAFSKENGFGVSLEDLAQAHAARRAEAA
jgi:hypothetical protein